MPKSRIVEGLNGALEHAKTERVIFDWIRDDAPLSVKMALHPEHVAKLVDRLVGSTTRFVDVPRDANK